MHQLNKNFNYNTLLHYFITIFLSILIALFTPQVIGVQWINGWHSPMLDILFAGITNLGDGIFIVLFSLLLLFHRFYLSIAMLVNGIFQGLVVSLFKRILYPAALRPIAFLDPTTVHFVEGVKVHRFMSFPSGHTITIFGLCVFLSLCSRNRLVTILMLVVAILVALSRVYLLQHFVMDIAVGAAIGMSIGALSYYYFESSNKPQWMTQRLEIRLKKSTTKPKFS